MMMKMMTVELATMIVTCMLLYIALNRLVITLLFPHDVLHSIQLSVFPQHILKKRVIQSVDLVHKILNLVLRHNQVWWG